MDRRKEKILGLIVESFVETSQPVGSKFLVEEKGLKVSAPTVRNEMRELEESGYLVQPHTSAGRIPSEEGYRYYLQNILKTKQVLPKTKEDIVKILDNTADFPNKNIKILAQYISEITGCAVITAFGPDSVYYAGISNLFSQPEFKMYGHLMDLSVMFDKCEKILSELIDKTKKEIEIFLGQENPLGGMCTTICLKFSDENLFLLIGPLRFDYKKNIPIMEFISKKLK